MTAPEPSVPNINPADQIFPESASDDAFFHELADDCPCGPTAESVKRDDGSVGWVLIHHSLDGREANE